MLEFIYIFSQENISTSFGVSKAFYGGSRSMLAKKSQGNMVSINICTDSSCVILKDIEKEKLGTYVKSPLTTDSVQQLATAFVDDNDFILDEKR